MDYRFIKVWRDGQVTWLSIDRPEVLNALHPPASLELSHALDRFGSDPSQRVAIITAEGDRAFCAGSDLKHRAGGHSQGAGPKGFGGMTHRFDCPKPIIAAVNGLAFGGGFELVLACDIVVASETASFALPEVQRGLAALSGGLHRLPRIIGRQAALALILTGRPITAAEALRLGLAADVVAPDQLRAAASRWAAQIVSASPIAVATSKRVVDQTLAESNLRHAMNGQEAMTEVEALRGSPDWTEGIQAFAAKRAPRWQS